MSIEKKTDEPAPFLLSVVMVGFYLLDTILLTVLLDIYPNLSVFARVIFPFVSIVGITTIALRQGHYRRLKAIEDVKNDRKEKRQTMRQITNSTNVNLITGATSKKMSNIGNSDTFSDKMQIGRQTKIDRQINQMIVIFKENPRRSITNVARELSISRQTVYKYLGELEENGTIRRNGHGVEFLK